MTGLPKLYPANQEQQVNCTAGLYREDGMTNCIHDISSKNAAAFLPGQV